MSTQPTNESQLLNGAIRPTLVVGVIAVAISVFLKGLSGFYGALLAQIVVLIYFVVHIFISKISRNLDPMSTMALAMFSYFAKVIFMGVFLLLVTKFTDRSTVDRTSFAICAILITMAWLFGEIRSFLKLRVNLPLPKGKEDK